MYRGGKKALADGLQNGLCFRIFPYVKKIPHARRRFDTDMGETFMD